MGRTVGELADPGGGPIAEALGEYLLDFAEVEATLSFLFAFLKSRDADDPGRWNQELRELAEKEISDSNLSAGRLAGEVNRLVLEALDEGFESESRARDVWRDLADRGCPVVQDRNSLVHRQLTSVDEVIGTPQTGLVLRNGVLLTEPEVRTRAMAARQLANDLRNFYGTFLGAKVQSKSGV